jgi:hypothetical protein
VSGENSRFCQNINREHSRNRIYFFVDANGVSQRCHDSATEETPEMRYGLCSAYNSGRIPIPQRLIGPLFKTTQPPRVVFGNDDDVRMYRDKKLVDNVAYIDFLANELGYATWSSSISMTDGQRIIRRTDKEVLTTLDPNALGSNASKTLRAMGLLAELEPRQKIERRVRPSLVQLESELLEIMDTWVDVYASKETDTSTLWARACRTDELISTECEDLRDLYRL